MRHWRIIILIQWSGLLLLGAILTACSEATLPAPAATVPLSMPLPRSEMTRLAAVGFTQSPTSGPRETPSATPTAVKIPTSTSTASPSPSPPLPSPTEIVVITPGQPRSSQATLEAAPVIEETKRPPAPTRRLGLGSLLMWLCASAFGALLLVLAAAMVASQARRKQAGLRHPPPINQLKPGQVWAEVFGRVAYVPRPLGGGASHNLAGIRLRVEYSDGKGGWKVLLDRSRFTPFYLSDDSGSILIEPDPKKVRFVGEGNLPTPEQLLMAQSVLSLTPLQSQGRDYRLRYWELRQGQQVGVVGSLHWLLVLQAFQVGHAPGNIPLSAIPSLKPGSQNFVRGRIAEVPLPLDLDGQRPLALVRLLVREYQPQTGWITLVDERRVTVFRLQDEVASIWIRVAPDNLTFSGRGVELPPDQLPAYLKALGLPGLSTAGRTIRCALWAYRQGDPISVSGMVEEVPTLEAHELDISLERPPLMPIASLQSGQGPVRVHGKVTQVSDPLDDDPKAPLAILRLLIEEQTEKGWKKRLDEVRSSPFVLDDGSGRIWVHAEKPDTEFMGEGMYTSAMQAEKALLTLKRPISAARGKGLRYRLWEVRRGEPITVSGWVTQQLMLTNLEAPKSHYPLRTLPPLGDQGRPRAVTLGMIGVISLLGLCLLCLSLSNLVGALLGLGR